MTPEQQRIAIAEACGWKRSPVEEGSFVDPSKTIKHERWISPHGFPERKLPDYLSDLNAMHEVEKVLTDEQCNAYRNTLLEIHRPTDYQGRWTVSGALSATAAQRAEAFLRTLNLWKE